MRDVIVAFALAAALIGCASTPRAVPPSHPAHADAPAGRLAGAPPALRSGVVKYDDVPPVRTGPPPDHSHHHK